MLRHRTTKAFQRVVFPSRYCSSSSSSIKDDILTKALSYHATLGWTDEAIVKSVQDLNINPVSHTIISRGAVETVEYLLQLKHKYIMLKVKELNDDLAPFSDPTQEDIVNRKKKILKHALNTGFDFMEPYRINWASALALLLSPAQLPHTLEITHNSVDDLCAVANIQTARYDWYTERAAIATLISMTEMHSVQDTSINLEDTR